MNVVDAEQDRLQSLEQQFSRWQDWILEQSNSDALDPDIVRRMTQTVERLVTLDGELHEEDFDPQALAELRGYIIRMIGIASKFDEADALDQLDQALVTLEAMRHIVRAALDQHIDGAGHDPAQAVAGIYAALSHQRKSEIAKLVGVSPRHLQRLARGEGTAPRRLELVARLVALLKRGWTEEGILAWFARPRSDLGGLVPASALEDPALDHALLTAARQGRAQHGG